MKLKNKLSAMLVLGLLAVFGSGCGTTGKPNTGIKPLPPAFYQIGTATALQMGLRNSPQTASYLRSVQPVLCAAAKSDQLTPAEITAYLESGQPPGATPESTALYNGILMLYVAAFNQLGNTNAATVRPYAEAIFCEGFRVGLIPLPATKARNGPAPPRTWPLLRAP